MRSFIAKRSLLRCRRPTEIANTLPHQPTLECGRSPPLYDLSKPPNHRFTRSKRPVIPARHPASKLFAHSLPTHPGPPPNPHATLRKDPPTGSKTLEDRSWKPAPKRLLAPSKYAPKASVSIPRNSSSYNSASNKT